jgi:hypothetical protein
MIDTVATCYIHSNKALPYHDCHGVLTRRKFPWLVTYFATTVLKPDPCAQTDSDGLGPAPENGRSATRGSSPSLAFTSMISGPRPR